MNMATRPLIWRHYPRVYDPTWDRWCAAYMNDRRRVVIDVGSKEALVAAMRLLSGACELNIQEAFPSNRP